MAEITRILSIDGGGIRGIIPAAVLAEIEKRTGHPASELFDAIAGTSTGGIIALGLCCPDANGAPRYNAQQLVQLYLDEGSAIFPHEFLQGIRSLVDEKYSARGLETALARYFGDVMLGRALVDVLVPAYDIERRQPIFFRSARAKADPTHYDFPMRLIARATSAAPTYFEPLRLPAAPPDDHYTLVDGGLVANNPGMCAYVDEWIGAGTKPENVLLISLGTGDQTRPIPYDKAKDWGLVQWARPVIDVALDGGSEVTQFQLQQILGANYHRLQTRLDHASDSLDNTEPANLAALQGEAARLIQERNAEIDLICTKLLDALAGSRTIVGKAAPGVATVARPDGGAAANPEQG